MQELLRYRYFVRFWFARVAAVAGTQMLLLGIGWHMYELTGSAWDLGLVGLFQFAPALVTTLVAGHVADHFHRARLVALCLAMQAGVAIFLVAATQAHAATRELLLALSVVLGALRPFQMSAQQALVPSLIPTSLLSRAMALSSSGQQVAVIGGPAAGGLLFAVGVNAVYATCAALFGLACIVCLYVRHEHTPAAREPVTARTLLAGARFIWAHPLLLGAVSLDLFAVLLGGATALLPIFAKEILKVGPEGLGLLRSAPAIGALLVGVTLARHPLSRGVGKKLLLAVGVYGVCIVVFGLSKSFWLSAAALAMAGGADMVSVVVRQTLVQLETPDHMRGRVAAINTLFIGASNQLGEFESGFTAAAFGPIGSVVMGGLGTIFISLAWLRLFKPLAARESLG
ncbi:MFS transporter [Xylophilus sp. GW821-FHT01B05]